MLLLSITTGFALLGGLLIGWTFSMRTRRRLKHSFRFLQTLVTQAPDAFFYQDLYDRKKNFTSQALALTFTLKHPIRWTDILAKFSPENNLILKTAYNDLIQHGKAFSLMLPNLTSSTHFLITGQIVYATHYHGILIAFRDVSDLAQQLKFANLMEEHKNILANALDSLNFPLFIRDAKGLTFFANQAVNQEKATTLNELSWLSLPFQADNSFYTLTYGQDTKTEEELQQILANMLKAQRRLCEKLPCAACLFNAAGQLLACSPSFAKLWGLDKRWLQSEPSYEDYWDVIQEKGLLSRVADFADYKRQQREDFARLSDTNEVFLYLPDGRIIRRILIPYVQGSVILLDEDHTNKKK